MSLYREIDMKNIHINSIKDRKSKVWVHQLVQPWTPGSDFKTFWKQLPSFLASQDLKNLVNQIAQAFQSEKPVLIMMGAHVIKVGLSPIIIDLMKHKIVTGIALNGAGAIHDMELSYFGHTSEDVVTNIKDGTFGMAAETAELLNMTVQKGIEDQLGFGEVLGKRINEDQPSNESISILGQAYQLGVPVTVHVALGTDIVHQHPNANGSAIGDLSLRDFRIWAELVSLIGDGGVVLLLGSSVILPEVFLKSLTVARNIKGSVNHFTTASFDMIQHYRPRQNVIERPNQEGGRGYTFIGHHEIMIPLLAAAIKEKIF